MLNFHRKSFRHWLTLLLAMVVSGPVGGQVIARSPALGEFSLSDLMLEPYFELRESQEAEFSLRQSFLAVDWRYQDWLSSRWKVGQKQLIGQPSRYGALSDGDELALIEAYGLFQSGYGDVAFGLLPIEFGFEGGDRESELLFSRSLFFASRIFGHRDLGLSFVTEHGQFRSRWYLHNGEGGADLDNRVWFTALWDWRNGGWVLGASATTGKTTPESTFQLGNTSTDTVFDPTENAEWRIGNFHGQFVDRYLTVRLELFTGRVLQDVDVTNEFFSGYISVSRSLSENYTVGLRYDYLDPDGNLSGDRFSEMTFLFSLHNSYQTSRLYFEATASFEDTSGVFDDRFLLVWRLSPNGQVFDDLYR